MAEEAGAVPVPMDTESPEPEPADGSDLTAHVRRANRMPSGPASADEGGDRHIAVAVPIRAVQRNRRIAASVLAGGFAYRIVPVAAAVRAGRRGRARAQRR